MTCSVQYGVVFCQMTPLGFAFAVWFLVTLGVFLRHGVGKVFA